MWWQLLILAQSKCNCPMWSFFSVILSINEWHLIQEECSNYACSMHSCQTFGQIPASSPFSVTRFRIKGKLWTELVTEASSGGPQSIPATNPPCPNSRSSSPLSPPYIPRAPTTPHFFLSDHQGCWYLPSASPSSAWHSLLVSTKRFDNCCHNRHPAPYGHYCYQPPWQWKHRTWSSRTHCHSPPGDVFEAPPPTPPPTGDRPREMFGPAKSDWYLHNQLVISWQPSVRQHNNKVDDWMSTRVSGCQVCAYGHPIYLNKVFVWSTRDLLVSKLKMFLHTHSTTSHTKHRWRKST